MCAASVAHFFILGERKIKRLTAIILAFCILFALSACSGNNSAADGSAYPEDLITEDFKIPLGNTGAKVAIPAEMGFETYESELNEFSGGGPNGEWRIVVNTEPRSDYPDYTLEVYADLLAQSNGAVIEQDGNGNYFFTHTNDSNPDKVYKLHTSVREGTDFFYQISFYCFDTTWDNYKEKFAEWATTIEVV